MSSAAVVIGALRVNDLYINIVKQRPQAATTQKQLENVAVITFNL